MAKKIVSRQRFSLSQSLFFMRGLGQNFVPNLLQHLECRATKLCVYKTLEETVHRKSHAKHVLKTRFNYNNFTRYSGINTQGSQEFIPSFSYAFTCTQFDMLQISNDCMHVT